MSGDQCRLVFLAPAVDHQAFVDIVFGVGVYTGRLLGVDRFGRRGQFIDNDQPVVT